MRPAAPAQASRPWYREPLVWLLVALPLSAVIGGITTIVLAVRSDDGLVVDDYYRRGLAINADLARERRAAELGLELAVDLGTDGRTLEARLTAAPGFHHPEALRLRLSHATRAGFDRTVRLPATTPGRYRGALDTPLEPGRWYAEVATTDWRLVTSLVSDKRQPD